MLALLASHNQAIYRLDIDTVDDIAAAIHAVHVETIPVAVFDFWVTPSLRPARLNRAGTKMLAGSSAFTGRAVPLLRGGVVVTARDRDGQLRSLSEEESRRLVGHLYDMPRLTDWVVDWRLARAERSDLRRLRHARINGA